jgi:protein-S-isoprenylcysteine O-methyltransferase Ste14
MEDNAGVTLPPPAIFIVTLVVAIVLNHCWPIYTIPQKVRWVGVVLILMGLAAIGGGVSEFRKFKTSFVPIAPAKAMLDKGIFAKTRNPLYLGLLCIYVGVACLFSTVWAFLFLPLVLFAITKLVIVKEEAYLERRFGERYLDYKSRVRRWM